MIPPSIIRRVTLRLALRRVWADLSNLLSAATLAYLLSASFGCGHHLLPTHPRIALLALLLVTLGHIILTYRSLLPISRAAARAFTNHH